MPSLNDSLKGTVVVRVGLANGTHFEMLRSRRILRPRLG